MLITFVLLIASTLGAYARENSNESVCSNPLQRICADTSGQRHERNKYITSLKKQISHEAKINSLPRVAKMKKKIKPIHFFKRQVRAMTIRNQEIIASAVRHIVGFESVVSAENISKIKNYMYLAIDSSDIKSEAKNDFKNIIRSIVVGNFNDFIERENLEESVFAQRLESICGVDGLIDNAFSTTLKGDRYVLICPGFLITLSQTASDSDRFNNILHTIAHEMGHHIDNKHYFNSDVYGSYLHCISKNYSNYFNLSDDDRKFCQMNSSIKGACNKKITMSHSGELIADEWGIAVTALHVKAQSYSVSEADQMLTDSWAKLCGGRDEGIHPTTDFRIENLLRKNPEIVNYLSCLKSETNSIPTCTFSGEI
jgi:hypothetical protein